MDQQQRNFQNKIIAISIIFSLLAGFIAGGLSSDLFKQIDWSKIPALANFTTTKSVQNSPLTPQEAAVESVVKQASPAVVSVIISKNLSVAGQQSSNNDPFAGTPFEGFFVSPSTPDQLPSTQKQVIGGGTGFIISSDGLILTNKHVVSDAQADYSVLTNGGQEYPAKVLAIDPLQDIAVLKINKTGLPILPIGDSSRLQIGQTAIAIGNALGEFRNTVSVGVISGLGRSVAASTGFGSPAEQLQDVIQTDAAVNPGNSGGPLLNSSGEVVGINVAVAQGAQSIGFALPINQAKRDIDQVKQSGKIVYPYLGVRYVLITPQIKQADNLSVDYGALVLRGQNQGEAAVAPGGPADKAGILENDIILEIDGQKITADNTLAQIIARHNIGDAVILKILSKGQEKTVRVTLGESK